MQYAQILINTKTDQLDKTFTYQIPPQLLPYIKTGSMVKIPFGPRKKKGIVQKITRQVSSDIKYKLKPIKSLEFKTGLLDDIHFRLASMISNYYLTNFGQLIFFMIPKLSKRILKSYQSSPSQAGCVIGAGKEKIYSIYDKKNNRIKYYIKLINQAFKKKKSVILLCPDFDANKIYIQKIKKEFEKFSIVFNPEDNATENTKKWIKLKKNKKSLVVGTRNTIFQIPNRLGLIILDEPDHFGYKEEQTTHHHSKKVSQFLAKITGANLVFGDNFPEVSDYFTKRIKNLIFQKDYIKKKKITLIDNSQNKTNIFSYPIEKIISDHLNKNKKILILTRGRGISAGLVCVDCEELIHCPRCDCLMYKEETGVEKLKCSVCSYRADIPKKCSNCGSVNLREFGLPVKRLAQLIRDKLPKQNINILEKECDFIRKYKSNELIFVSSNYALSWKNLCFDSLLVLDWENWQVIRGYDYSEKLVKNFINLSEISNKNIYIQTTNPEDEILKDLILKKFVKIYESEFLMRQKFAYPPAYQLIKFSSRDKLRKKSENKVQNLKTMLVRLLGNCQITDIADEGKKRDKYCFNLLVKTKTNHIFNLKRDLIKNYKTLNLSDYLIDVDPIKIL